MNIKQIELVKNSWAILSTLEPSALSHHFYNRLFEILPSLNYPADIQTGKFMSMMGHIINRLDRPEAITKKISSFAEQHLKYKLQPGHYLFAGNALLQALASGLKENWNEEVREAWANCYTSLSNAAIEATCPADVA